MSWSNIKNTIIRNEYHKLKLYNKKIPNKNLQIILSHIIVYHLCPSIIINITFIFTIILHIIIILTVLVNCNTSESSLKFTTQLGLPKVLFPPILYYLYSIIHLSLSLSLSLSLYIYIYIYIKSFIIIIIITYAWSL